MILYMFSYGYCMFPSPQEIKQGIQFALYDQMQIVETNNERHAEMFNMIYSKITDKIKELGELPNPKVPLTSKQLSQPSSKIVDILMSIYTMESFIYRDMNKASREQDMTKLKYYGPLAATLGFIIQKGNLNKRQLDNGQLYLFRGLQENQDIVNAKYNVGNLVDLKGFTSCTLDRNKAVEFAFNSDLGDDAEE